MAQPTFLGSGTTPKKGDSRWLLLCKLLGAVQNNAASAKTANNPKRSDTRRRLLMKIERAHAGIGNNGA